MKPIHTYANSYQSGVSDLLIKSSYSHLFIKVGGSEIDDGIPAAVESGGVRNQTAQQDQAHSQHSKTHYSANEISSL
jgi:hypothetical protein